MKKFLSIVLLFSMIFLVSCSRSESKQKIFTAEEIVTELKNAGLPIENIIVYNENNDPNKLLGRPNQYVTKINFADSRLDQYDENNPEGGSVETFNNEEDLNKRKEYIESITGSVQALTEYMYINGNYLLRLNKGLTPTQAKEYEDIFMKIGK